MACDLIQGNEVLCRDSVGGVKTLYVANFTNVQAYTESSGVCSAITMVPNTKFYTFQLEKENATYENKMVGSVENGTTYFESTFTHTMKKLSASMKNSIKTLGQSRLVIIVEDNNGVKYVIGLVNGVDVVDVTMTTGKAFGDMNGATMNYIGKQPNPDPTFTGSIATITV
jgi:hypothetical protein